MRVVVIGGGFGGMATAARLAKLGHQVTLLEASETLGGALGAVRASTAAGDFVWDSGAHHTLLPAVIRDLFRKSGRPLERELDLEPLSLVREHRFADGSVLALPGGSRAAQVRAGEALGAGLGRAWVEHVDPFGRDWELLRRDYYERPWQPDLASDELRAVLTSRETLAQRVRRTLPDARLRAAATFATTLEGHDAGSVPAWVGLSTYLEQNFGVWRVPGGMHLLGEAMAQRLRTRKVEVALATPALDVVVHQGRATGVRTADGTIEADAVVSAIDPARLPALTRYTRRTRSTTPPHVVHLALREDHALPELGPEGHEVVLHPAGQRPLFVLRTGGTAPAGHRAWTVLARDLSRTDVLDALADRGLDLRAHVVHRLDRTPADLTSQWGGSPDGDLWQGRKSVERRLGPLTPVAGLLAAGSHAAPGAGLPATGLSGALVAQVLGKA